MPVVSNGFYICERGLADASVLHLRNSLFESLLFQNSVIYAYALAPICIAPNRQNTCDKSENDCDGDNGENDCDGDNGENDCDGDNDENDCDGDNDENDCNRNKGGDNDCDGDNVDVNDCDGDNDGDNDCDSTPETLDSTPEVLERPAGVILRGRHPWPRETWRTTWRVGTKAKSPCASRNAPLPCCVVQMSLLRCLVAFFIAHFFSIFLKSKKTAPVKH